MAGPQTTEPEATQGTFRTFENILASMLDIHRRKAHDYTSEQSPLGNFMESRRVGVEASKACFIRLQDKYTRACNLIGGAQAQVKEETVEDTLVDMANYCILTILCLQEERG